MATLIRRMTRMGKVRDRAANYRVRRRRRVLGTLERLEARYVLNAGSLPIMFGAPPQPDASPPTYDSSEYVAGPRGSVDSHLSPMREVASDHPNAGPAGLVAPPDAGALTGVPHYGLAGGDGFRAAAPSSVTNFAMPYPTSVVDVNESRMGAAVIVEHYSDWAAISYLGGGPSTGVVVVGSHVELDTYSASKTYSVSLQGALQPTARQLGPDVAIGLLPAVAALPQLGPSPHAIETVAQGQAGSAAAGPARPTISEQPRAITQVHQAIVTAGSASTGSESGSDSTIRGGLLIVRNAPPAANRSLTGSTGAADADPRRWVLAAALAGGSRAGAAADVALDKASLASISLDMRGVERALQTVMEEIELLGAGLTHWMDDVHFSRLAVAVTAAALGFGSAYYYRRGGREAVRGDDEESLSWLFARLQPIPGE
jgi:hypothetical protein